MMYSILPNPDFLLTKKPLSAFQSYKTARLLRNKLVSWCEIQLTWLSLSSPVFWGQMMMLESDYKWWIRTWSKARAHSPGRYLQWSHPYRHRYRSHSPLTWYKSIVLEGIRWSLWCSNLITKKVKKKKKHEMNYAWLFIRIQHHHHKTQISAVQLYSRIHTHHCLWVAIIFTCSFPLGYLFLFHPSTAAWLELAPSSIQAADKTALAYTANLQTPLDRPLTCLFSDMRNLTSTFFKYSTFISWRFSKASIFLHVKTVE